MISKLTTHKILLINVIRNIIASTKGLLNFIAYIHQVHHFILQILWQTSIHMSVRDTFKCTKHGSNGKQKTEESTATDINILNLHRFHHSF